MTIYEEKAEAIKKAVRALENCIADAEGEGLSVELVYQRRNELGYRYIETVIALPILNLP